MGGQTDFGRRGVTKLAQGQTDIEKETLWIGMKV